MDTGTERLNSKEGRWTGPVSEGEKFRVKFQEEEVPRKRPSRGSREHTERRLEFHIRKDGGGIPSTEDIGS